MSPTDPVLAHLLSRLEADVRFLADQGHISQADSQTVLGVFSRAGSGSVANLAANFGGVSLGARDVPGMPAPYGAPSPAPASYGAPTPYGAPPAPVPSAPPAPYSPAPTPYNANNQGQFNTPAPAFPGGPPAPAYGTPSPAPSNSALKRPVPPPPPASTEPQCKALWDYNLDGKLGGDLTFRSGDVITIVKEDNPDWWTGRLNGREGMFPSNHVEKVPPSAPGYNPSYGYDEKQQYAPPSGPPAAYQQGGPVQAPATEEEKKKGKFGKYGSMMAGSAAGGLGFGAGAAVGSGLINAIF